MRHSRVSAVLAGSPASLNVRLHLLPHLLLSANTFETCVSESLVHGGVPIDRFISYLCS